jgi:ABC-type sugar transport system ATPase subunit
MSQVNIESIVKRFGQVTALDHVSLAIPKGAFVVLLGPSGCGKTSLLRLIAGLDTADSGRIVLGDKDITHVHARDRDIAMVFQSYALYPHMSVRRNMSFSLELRKVPRARIDERVEAVAQTLGIGHLLDRRPKQLSGGQRQRVALGRAIVREPSVFLFDEPLSNLDAKLRTAMRGELIRLHKRLGTTVVYVTHDQVEAMTMGQLVVVMKDGRIEQLGPPLEVYRNPQTLFVAEFIGSPAMNLLPGRIDAAQGCIVSNDGNLRLPLDAAAHARPPGSVSPAAADPAAAYPGAANPGAGNLASADLAAANLASANLASADPAAADPAAADGAAPNRAAPADVVIGLRPEHIAIRTGAERPGEVHWDGVVEVIEPLGAETFIEVNCRGTRVMVRVSADILPAAGETLRLAAEAKRFHIFDAHSGRRIEHVSAPDR